MGWKWAATFFKISCADPLAIGQVWWLLDCPETWAAFWLCRFDRIPKSRINFHRLLTSLPDIAFGDDPDGHQLSFARPF